MIARMLAMTRARSLEFLRDRSSLGWNLLFPLLMVGGFALIFSGPGQPLFKVAVLAEAPLTAELHPFLGTAHTQFYRETDVEVAVRKVARYRVDMLLDLRPGQARYWVNDGSPKGQVLEQLLQGSAGSRLTRVAVDGRPVRYVEWVAPGLLGMNMMFSCLFGIGYVIVRYRKSGYLKRLKATPLTALEFISAQLLSRLLLIMVITTIMFLGFDLVLDFQVQGSYWTLLLLTLLGAVSMIAMGLVVSARVTSEELAGGLLNIFSWPMMVLSGVFFSLDGAPELIQQAALLFPLTHLLVAVRAVMLDGAGLVDIWPHLLVLGGLSGVFLLLGAVLFRWTQD